MFPSKGYRKLEAEHVNNEHDTDSHFEQPRWSRHLRLMLAANLVIFGSSIILCFWAFYTVQKSGNSRNDALRQTNAYSPILDELNLRLSTIRVNGTDEDLDHSIYRQPPSPETDAAWSRLSNSRTIWISSSDIKKIGKDPATVAHFPSSFNLGSDAYAAELDIYHKIHCLNTLRKAINFDYYYGDRFPDGKPSELHTAHVTHCLYILLQSLMCEASTNVFTKEWVEGQRSPFPDFSIERKCGDFEAIGRWQDGRLVDEGMYKAWRMPEGHTPVPVSDELKRLLRYSEYGDQ